MHFSGRIIGLLKEYMHDLVEQAKQEEAAHASFGFASQPYRADQAISDLLAILDDRIESEGVQVGLPVEFLHRCGPCATKPTHTFPRPCGYANIWIRGPDQKWKSGHTPTRP